MKASLKFREDQKPLIRAKIPISILGLPFLSGIAAGDSKELRLDLITAFDSGPSLRASYRPNDPSNPFSLSLKTGIGSLGSPAGAPMSMTAEFNILGGGNPNPTFTVLFKPRFGDFSFKKLTGSAVTSPPSKKVSDIDGDTSAVWVESPPPPSQLGLSKVNAGWPAVSGMLTGVEVNAKSVLPVKGNAAVRFKWGVRVPAEFQNALVEGGHGRIPGFNKLPLLVMSKISIEHVVSVDRKEEEKGGDVSSKGVVGAADVAEACMSVKKQLEAIQAENGNLRRAVEELKGSIPIPVGSVVGPARDGKREGKYPEASGRAAQKKEDVNEELKKALMGAAGGAK